jgi:hypothetical protein
MPAPPGRTGGAQRVTREEGNPSNTAAAAVAQDAAIAELPRALTRLLMLALAVGLACGAALGVAGCVWAHFR